MNKITKKQVTFLEDNQVTPTCNNIFEMLTAKTSQLAVVGLGYVGLPIALEFAKYFSVLGFDINEEKIKKIQKGVDPSDELKSVAFQQKDISFSHLPEIIKSANFYIVAVPTPIDELKQPNLNPLISATKMVGRVLKKGDIVVFESTVYPGCTEEICIPILEKESGLKFKIDFKVGYSPERINPGDKKRTIETIVKIVSGCDEDSLEIISKVYNTIIKAGTHRAPSIKVAEAAKIIENTQRDVNIALINELSMIFEKMNINTYDVLEAAGTKWNFLNFYPGLVGGHCIGVDAYYLIQKAIRVGHNPLIISAARKVNDIMPQKITQKIIKELEKKGKHPKDCKVLVKGITFKENVTDIRNSKAIDLVKALNLFCNTVDVEDPIASPKLLREQYGIELQQKIRDDYDVIILAVSHKEYYDLTEKKLISISNEHAFLMDIKGILKGKIRTIDYFTL